MASKYNFGALAGAKPDLVKHKIFYGGKSKMTIYQAVVSYIQENGGSVTYPQLREHMSQNVEIFGYKDSRGAAGAIIAMVEQEVLIEDLSDDTVHLPDNFESILEQGYLTNSENEVRKEENRNAILGILQQYGGTLSASQLLKVAKIKLGWDETQLRRVLAGLLRRVDVHKEEREDEIYFVLPGFVPPTSQEPRLSRKEELTPLNVTQRVMVHTLTTITQIAATDLKLAVIEGQSTFLENVALVKLQRQGMRLSQELYENLRIRIATECQDEVDGLDIQRGYLSMLFFPSEGEALLINGEAGEYHQVIVPENHCAYVGALESEVNTPCTVVIKGQSVTLNVSTFLVTTDLKKNFSRADKTTMTLMIKKPRRIVINGDGPEGTRLQGDYILGLVVPLSEVPNSFKEEVRILVDSMRPKVREGEVLAVVFYVRLSEGEWLNLLPMDA